MRWWFGARARALGRVARRRIVSDLPVEKVLLSRPRVEGEVGPKPWLGFFSSWGMFVTLFPYLFPTDCPVQNPKTKR